MNATNTLKKQGSEKTFDYIYKDPDKNMPKIMDWADKGGKKQMEEKTKKTTATKRDDPRSDHRSRASIL